MVVCVHWRHLLNDVEPQYFRPQAPASERFKTKFYLRLAIIAQKTVYNIISYVMLRTHACPSVDVVSSLADTLPGGGVAPT